MKSCILMHQEKQVALIQEDGSCFVCLPQFMPWNLRLEEAGDPETRRGNLSRFYFWCANRPLALERTGATVFLLSHGIRQAETDAERAEIALCCRGLCMTDVFWIRKEEEDVTYARIRPFGNPLPGNGPLADCPTEEYVDIVLRDRGMIARNAGLVIDEKQADVFSALVGNPNVWVRRGKRILLLKHGNPDELEAELLASRIARCFDVDQVLYEPMVYQGRRVSGSELCVTEKESIVTGGDMAGYLARTGKNLWELVQEQDAYSFHMMNIIDYLVGNTDRHLRNWGFRVSNGSHTPGKLFPLMDFNRSFRGYDSPEGSACMTTKEPMSQKEAAVRGVRAIGLNLSCPLPEDVSELFSGLNALRGTRLDLMFRERLNLLQQS